MSHSTVLGEELSNLFNLNSSSFSEAIPVYNVLSTIVVKVDIDTEILD